MKSAYVGIIHWLRAMTIDPYWGRSASEKENLMRRADLYLSVPPVRMSEPKMIVGRESKVTSPKGST
jgi:hypothetical protein